MISIFHRPLIIYDTNSTHKNQFNVLSHRFRFFLFANCLYIFLLLYQNFQNIQFPILEENDFIETWILENQNPKKNTENEIYTQQCENNRNHKNHQTYTIGKKQEPYSNEDTFSNQESEDDYREHGIKSNIGKFNHYIRQHKSLR